MRWGTHLRPSTLRSHAPHSTPSARKVAVAPMGTIPPVVSPLIDSWHQYDFPFNAILRYRTLLGICETATEQADKIVII